MRPVAVSAGHYPESPGVIYQGYKEHDEAVLWQDIVLNELRSMGIETLRVPTGRLSRKTDAINAARCSLAVEIHFNASPGWAGSGSETLYYPGSARGMLLASRVQSALSSIAFPNRGAKEGWYQADPAKGVLWFLEKTKCTALVIEPYFFHEQSRIRDTREICCQIIAEVLRDWVKETENADD